MRKRQLLASLAGLTALTLTKPVWSAHGLPEKFDPARDPTADVQQAVVLAQAQRKMVLVDVGGQWCTWCHIFDRFVAYRPEVLKTLQEHYILVKVNYSPQNRNEQLLSRWPKARGYPHFYVLSAAGTLVASQANDELESGKDYDEAKVLAFLRRQQPT
jgi:thiol:disulfide interchange protein